MVQKLVPDIIGKQKVVTLGPKDTVRAAVRMLAEGNAGAVMVAENSRLVGILSERDVVKRVVAPGLDPDATSIDAVMTRNPDALPPDATVQDALKLMVGHDYRHVPVVDGQRIVGMVSALDIYGNVVKSIQSGVSNITRTLLG